MAEVRLIAVLTVAPLPQGAGENRQAAVQRVVLLDVCGCAGHGAQGGLASGEAVGALGDESGACDVDWDELAMLQHQFVRDFAHELLELGRGGGTSG